MKNLTIKPCPNPDCLNPEPELDWFWMDSKKVKDYKLWKVKDYYKLWFVGCIKCGFEGGNGKTNAKAIERWNSRKDWK